MLHTFTPSLSALSSQPSTSKNDVDDKSDPALLDIEGEVSSLRSKNLSSTLQKLYLWEKKLYEEVKVLFLEYVNSYNILVICFPLF